MCLRPHTIRNPTKYISAFGGQPLLLDVPCGHCAECKKAKRDEWRFRSYYQVNECVHNGGYVYFDTLTYSEDKVPRLSRFFDCAKHGIEDFTCFDSADWRNFLKNLRRQLDYHHRGVSFKYFLTSEYGTDERYTHRPHYHILFFVNTRLLDPYTFSALVAKCWDFGRTDGIPYQSREYVREHVFGFDLGQDNPLDYMKACNYVSKYVTKDSTFQDRINLRKKSLAKVCDDDELKSLCRNIDMFHRQSQGYGYSFINALSVKELDDIIQTGVCKRPDTLGVVMPLPLYYKRKLFYNLKRDDDGSFYWQYNNLGYEYAQHGYKRNIKNLTKRYYTQLINSTDEDKEYVSLLLAGRSLADLASYVTLYRSRCRCMASPTNNLSETEMPYNWLNSLNKSFYVRELSFTDIYLRDIDSNTINVCTGLPDIFNHQQRSEYYYDSFLKTNIFNENSCTDFKDFDKIIAYISAISQPDKHNKQTTFDFVEDLTKKFKHFENYGY